MDTIKVDQKGRILIPKNIREIIGLKEGNYVKIKVYEKCIIIEPIESIADKYFGVFKIEKCPEDLDEFTVKVVREWWTQKSYIDINVFVYWLGKHPTFGHTAYKWIKKIEEVPKGNYITSTLTLYQTLVTIAGLSGESLSNRKFVEEVLNSIINLPGLTLTPLTIEDLIQSIKLMEEYNLDYEDAVHLAMALRNKVKEIISNDEDFDKTPLKRIFNLK